MNTLIINNESMVTLGKSRIVGITALALTTLFALGVGCTTKQGSSTISVNTTNTMTTLPKEPTGASTEDSTAVENTINQMESTQDAATNSITEVENSAAVDSYTLPTGIPE